MLVTLLLGDPSAPKGVRWELGRVAMPGDGAAKPSYKSARAQAVNNYLPDIAHMFVSSWGPLGPGRAWRTCSW